MRVVGLAQARMGSQRLPGKIVREINGLPLIVHIWRRLLACRELDSVVVALGADKDCDEAERICKRHAMRVWTGQPEDLIDRLYRAGLAYDADAIVRVTGDEWCHDPALIDCQVSQFRFYWPKERGRANWPHRTHSEGVDFEIWSMELLAELDRTKECPREGFAAWVCDDEERAMKYGVTLGLQHPKNDGEPHLSIDTEEDARRAAAMLKLIGNDTFDYESTMRAYKTVMAEE